MRLVATTGQALRIDSRGKPKAERSKKEGASYIVTSSDQLIAKLVIERNVSMKHATEIMDMFDETDWSDGPSMRRLRRLAIRLLGETEGGEVFGILRANMPSE